MASNQQVMIAQKIAGGGGGTTVTLDGTVTHGNSTITTCTVSHTTGALTNGLMVVGVTLGDSGGAPVIVSVINDPTGVNEALTLVNSVQPNGDATGIVAVYRRIAPSSGTRNVVVTVTGVANKAITVGVVTFEGVNQTTPIQGTGNIGSGSGTLATATVSSATDDMIFAVHGMGSSWTSTNQTQQYIENVNGLTACGNGAANTAAGAASVAMTATGASDFWGSVGVDIQHA